jgi:hypothetical protein
MRVCFTLYVEKWSMNSYDLAFAKGTLQLLGILIPRKQFDCCRGTADTGVPFLGSICLQNCVQHWIIDCVPKTAGYTNLKKIIYIEIRSDIEANLLVLWSLEVSRPFIWAATNPCSEPNESSLHHFNLFIIQLILSSRLLDLQVNPLPRIFGPTF